MRVARSLLLGFVGLIALAGVGALAARFHDGPLGPFPGGKLSGTVVTDPPRWSAILAGVSRLELEVNPSHPRSITTSYLLHDDALYVPSVMAARKSWPQQVLADDRVVLRIGGKLYERRAVRVTDPAELRAVTGASDPDVPVDALSTWYFRIDPRRG